MPETKPATKLDVAVIGVVIIVLIGIAGHWFWIPTKQSVQRIEQKLQPCTGEQR